jgi:hypothetical protein
MLRNKLYLLALAMLVSAPLAQAAAAVKAGEVEEVEVDVTPEIQKKIAQTIGAPGRMGFIGGQMGQLRQMVRDFIASNDLHKAQAVIDVVNSLDKRAGGATSGWQRLVDQAIAESQEGEEEGEAEKSAAAAAKGHDAIPPMTPEEKALAAQR